MADDIHLPDEKARPATRNAAETRLAILKAARRAFAERSFELVGVRDVAQLAGVDRALIVRYFGSKEGLFRAALDAALTVEPLVQFDRRTFGKQVIDLLFTWSGHSAVRLISMAAGNPALRAYSLEQCEKLWITPLAEWLGEPDGHGRATSLLTLWTGFQVLWDLGLPAMKQDARVRTWLAEATQAIVDDARP